MAFKPRGLGTNVRRENDIPTTGLNPSEIEKSLKESTLSTLLGAFNDTLNDYEKLNDKGEGRNTVIGKLYNIDSLKKNILEKIEEENRLELLKTYIQILESNNYSKSNNTRYNKMLDTILSKLNARVNILETKKGVKSETDELLPA